MQNRFEDEAAAFPHAIPTVYHRLNVSSGIGRVIPLDSWRPASSGAQTKAAMLAATMAYLSRPGPDAALRETAQLLVRLRRRRAATERWERFAARFAYYCPEPGCPAQGRGFESRAELRAHAHERHGFWNGSVRGDQGAQGIRHKGGPRTFTDEAAYRLHLEREHRIVDWTKFGTRRAAEAWLDSGRIERRTAWRKLQRSGTVGNDDEEEHSGAQLLRQGLEREMEKDVAEEGSGAGSTVTTTADGDGFSEADVERLKNDSRNGDRDAVVKKLQLRVWRALLESRRRRRRQRQQKQQQQSELGSADGG
ncbi:hypothetical protein IWX92DRAFT_308424 [Phyllosticta citricarpa]